MGRRSQDWFERFCSGACRKESRGAVPAQSGQLCLESGAARGRGGCAGEFFFVVSFIFCHLLFLFSLSLSLSRHFYVPAQLGAWAFSLPFFVFSILPCPS